MFADAYGHFQWELTVQRITHGGFDFCRLRDDWCRARNRSKNPRKVNERANSKIERW